MKLIIILSIIFLTSCASNKEFDCPLGQGVNCVRVSEIDKRIDQGTLSFLQNEGKNLESRVLKTSLPTKKSNTPDRIPEVVLQVWVAPFQSEGEVYHQQSFLNLVVKEAAWLPPIIDVVSEQ